MADQWNAASQATQELQTEDMELDDVQPQNLATASSGLDTASLANVSAQGSRGRQLLAMSDDEDEDDDLLAMPSQSVQAIQLEMDQSFALDDSFQLPPEPANLHLEESIVEQPHEDLITGVVEEPKPAVVKYVDSKIMSDKDLVRLAMKPKPTPPPPAAATTVVPEMPTPPLLAPQHENIDDDMDFPDYDDDDEMFGADFLAMEKEEGFGTAADPKGKGKGVDRDLPLFYKRQPLSSRPTGIEDEDDDLDLESLSISQRHTGGEASKQPFKVPAPVLNDRLSNSESTKRMPSTTLSQKTSKASSQLYPGSMSQDASQYEEDLLEMSARQFDAHKHGYYPTEEDLMDQDDLNEIFAQQEESQAGPSSSSSSRVGLAKATRTSAVSGQKHSIEDVDNALAAEIAQLDVMLRDRARDASKRTKPLAPLAPIRPIIKEVTVTPKHDYSQPPRAGLFLNGKDSSGNTFYFGRKTVRPTAKDTLVTEGQSPNKKSLLPVPIHRMIDELDAEIRMQEREMLAEALENIESTESQAHGDTGGVKGKTEEKLWAEKYRPRNYMELMGDERINREVLSWVKEWDQCVFGKAPKKYVPDSKKQFQEFRKPDKWGRPDRKVLLLTGPPGLGKTTVAHVIARQAGYNVIEVNASDDRTGASVKGKIEAALQSQSILGSDRPNLLVIDEVDGVSSSGGEQSFIKLLIDMIQADGGESEKAKAAATTNSRRNANKKPPKQPLMRPIICICNDQYASVLRPLRTIAQIFQFRKPTVRSAVSRMQQICEIEKIPSDHRAFGALYEMTEGDMRSCMNTLQFIKNKSRSAVAAAEAGKSTDIYGRNLASTGLTLEALSSAAIGRKDQNKTLFSVWHEIFQAPYARTNRTAMRVIEEGRDGLGRDDKGSYVGRLVSLVHTNGEYERLMMGCFENYPSMIFNDTAMKKIVDNTEWLWYYDMLNSRVSTQFEYELGGYAAYAIVNFHRYFAGTVRQKVEYPRADYESFVALKASQSILEGFHLNLPAQVQRTFGKNLCATEFVSMFLRILSPPNLRPVNKQLIKTEEKMVLGRLVDVMIKFSMTFVQEKTEDGQFVYRLEPSIEKLGDYAGIGLKNVLTNRYAVRQLIAQEIEVELVRRSEEARQASLDALANGPGGNAKGKGNANSLSYNSATSSLQSNSLGMNGGDGDNASMDLTMKEPTDFFGRPIVKKEKEITVDDDVSMSDEMTERLPKVQQQQKPPARVWYKFNEGFSNAVKAKIFISELL